MKIGITGGTGFIGQYLLPELAPEHTLTVITSRKGTEGLYQHPNLSYLTAPYDREGFRRAFEACEAVVHLGAKRSTPEREKSITSYFENLETTEALFAACAELDIRNVVSISSVAVYDAGLPSPCPETQAPSPRSNYGVAKLAIEGMARLYNRRCGMRIKSLRVAQVLGLGERGGYMPAVFLERCLRQEKLSVYGRGTGGNEYIYVKDVVRAIRCALEAGEKCGVYNIGTGVLTSNLELAQAYCAAFENAAGWGLLPDRPEGKERFYTDVTLAERELGFRAAYPLCAALADMREALRASRALIS